MKKFMRITYVAIVASALLIAGIATVSLSYAGQGTKGKVISGPSTSILTVWCRPPASTEGCFDLRTVDLDGDDVDDIRIYSRHVVAEPTGVMEGVNVMHQTIIIDLATNTGTGRFTGIFTGTVGDSEPGSMMLTGAWTTDRSEFPFVSWEGNLQVVDDTGMGGLTGVCGGGSYQGSGGGGEPFIGTSNYEFRFGDACRSNM